MGGNPSRVKVSGPLVPCVAEFRAQLEAQGYRRHPVADQLRVMAHVSRWLEGRGLGVADLTPKRVEEFLAARRQAGYTLWLSPKAVAPLLRHLRGVGAAPEPEAPAELTPTDVLLEKYHTYLIEERALAVATVTSYLHVARLFLATRPQVPGLALLQLTAAEVIRFVLDECRQRSIGSAKYIVTGLRALLRFCYLEGNIPRPLADAVPAVASWRLAGLPKGLEPDQVAALLKSCDRRTTFGRRDYAVLTLLVRLGLRSGEVAHLRLDDIDWRAGELVVRGKGPKHQRLPLPVDVGEAIAAWLRRGRPASDAREVFTRVRAPHQALTTGGVTGIVASACKRAGIPEVRAHRLRHSAALATLRAGAGLVEIGQLLRHDSILTTSIYAKADRASLVVLAKPWPSTDRGMVGQ